MNKFIVYLFGFLLLAQANALACNFKISNFGDPKENVKLEGPQPISMPDQFGGESLLFPIIDVCKNDKSFDGTMLIYLYIENKLSQIQLYRPNMQDTKLMDFAMNNYGKFNLPEGLPKLMWRGNYQWEIGNDTIEYIKTDIHDGHAEVIEITNKLYANAMAEYNAKVGEWLDSQK
jgi:hypothetical protein|tara:strand:+ start:136 stop:660 length:525 start_codon:yes stop_codon:yes gene_type:complete